MKGDFSRSTFDPHKHYSSVRMQQGRVQLDADWNEQADILLHLITTQLKDLLGPGATAAAEPGFAITLVEPADEAADPDQAGLPEEPTEPVRILPDFEIGAGRYYVDGILCENEEPVRFSRQPDYPAAASRLGESLDADHVLVYLDVWQRHLTAWEDPHIREIALGGPDTTTRVKTVWQVKLLPLSSDPDDDQGWRERGGLRSLADWGAFVAQAGQKGKLNARWDRSKGAVPENHLYRVEIHTVDDGQVTFKWSRENGSVVFPIEASKEYLFTWEDVPGNDSARLLTYLRKGLALDWAEGESVQIDKPDDSLAIRIEKDGAWAKIVLDEDEKTATLTTSDGKRRVLQVRQDKGKHKLYEITNLSVGSGSIELNLEGLERDPYQLREKDWVEIADDATVLNGRPLPLCQVTALDRPNARVTLHAEQDKIDQILAEIGARQLHHRLLRRWEAEAKTIPPQTDTTAAQSETWLDLENGIQVSFTNTGTYQVGDYWLIPARTRSTDGIEWPQQDGQPLPRAPHGIAHRYAPLALLQFQDGAWSVIAEESTAFRNLPQITANLSATDGQLRKVQESVDTLVRQTHVFETVKSKEPLEKGDLVSLDRDAAECMGTTEPGTELPVKRASTKDGWMAVGVVWESIDKEGDGKRYRIVLYGRVHCKVIGSVKPGDLLVPSREPGRAQKAGLYLRPGTILGKALSSTQFDGEVVEEIEEGRLAPEGDMSKQPGTVDVLVTLG